MQETEFEIDRNAVKSYFLVLSILQYTFIFAPLIGFFALIVGGTIGGALVVFVWILSIMFEFWMCPRQANAFRYRLEGSTVRADGGVFFLFRKSIPLERITDVALVQGPLLRYFGIWVMQIQTAGSAQCEAVLFGVRNPEEVRELILSQRQRIYGEKAADA